MFRAVLGFYWGLALQALQTLGGALVRVDSWTGILTKGYFAIVGLLSRPLAERVNNLWDGLPWWAVAVLLAAWVFGLFVWGMAKANFEAFTKIKDDNAKLQEALAAAEKFKAFKNLLGEAIHEGELLRQDTPLQPLQEWVDRTEAFIEGALDKAAALRFLDNSGYGRKDLEYDYATEETWSKLRHEKYLREFRVRRLHELALSVKREDIDPDFDPQEWVDRK